MSTQLNQYSSGLDTMEDDYSADRMGEPVEFSVKRAGKRPLTFAGTELCMAMNFDPRADWWYELNMYRTTSQTFVTTVKLFHQSEDERDIFHAWECATFDEAMSVLECYDAGDDVRVDVAPDAHLPAAELAAHAMSLRARVVEARRQYKSLLGEMLYDLGAN